MVLARAVVGLSAFGLAAHRVVTDGVNTARAGNGYGALLLVPLAAAVVGLVTYRRSRRRVHVHDSEVDTVASIVVAFVVFVGTGFLSARLGWAATSVRLELLFAPLAVAAIGVPLYGFRAVQEQTKTIAVLLLSWPFPYTVASQHIDGSAFGWFVAAVVVAGAAAGLVDWPLARAILGFVVGACAAFAYSRARPDSAAAAPFVAILGVAALRILSRRVWLWRVADRPDASQPVGHPPFFYGALATLAIGGSLFFVPSTAMTEVYRARRSPEVPLESCPLPLGWQLTGQRSGGTSGERAAGRWASLRCEYRSKVLAAGRAVTFVLTEPINTSELGAFPAPSVMRVAGTLGPLTSRTTFDGSTMENFVWNDSVKGTQVAAVVWYRDVGDGRWQRLGLFVSPQRQAPQLRPVPRPLSATASRVGIVLRTQRNEAARFAVDARDSALARDLAQTLNQTMP